MGIILLLRKIGPKPEGKRLEKIERDQGDRVRTNTSVAAYSLKRYCGYGVELLGEARIGNTDG
jgi:hypothetical protein